MLKKMFCVCAALLFAFSAISFLNAQSPCAQATSDSGFPCATPAVRHCVKPRCLLRCGAVPCSYPVAAYPNCYTAYKPVPVQRTQTWTECKPVCEAKTKEVAYTVWKPEWEECEREVTVCRPVQELCTKEVAYTVLKPVHSIKTILVRSGHWETQSYQVPGRTFCQPIAPCNPCDPCEPRRFAQFQCPPETCYRNVWVPELQERVIDCVEYVPVQCVKTVEYCETKMVPETLVQKYKVCKMVPEEQVKTVTYQDCMMVPIQKSCTYTNYTFVPEKRCCCTACNCK